MDVTMLSRLQTLRPSMTVLFMSGYTDDAVVRHGLLTARVSIPAQAFFTGHARLESARGTG
jgi:two-component system cell cycle sensor histidine kinase/response regulator CckA